MKRIDLQYLVDYWDVDLPFRLDTLAGSYHSVVLEIGHGKGEFLVNRALTHPNVLHLGIEQSWPSIVYAIRRAMRFRASNIRFFFGHVVPILSYVFPARSVETIWVLFPDPWPKVRHEHHRFLHRRTWLLFWKILQPGGKVVIATDEKKLFEWILNEYPPEHFSFTMDTYSHTPRFGTKYEKKWLSQGKTIYIGTWHTIHSHGAIVSEKVQQSGGPMRIYFFPNIEPDRVCALEGSHRLENDIIVSFKHIFYDPKKEVYLIKTVIVEEGWTQKLFIVLYKGEKGWTLAPSDGCKILPTRGLQKVLDFIAHSFEHVHESES